MQNIQIATEQHIPLIKEMACTIWQVAYKHILKPQQMKYMLEKFYSFSSLKKQMNEQQHKFIIATDNKKSFGFASYSLKENFTDIFRLHKLYVLPEEQRKGTGRFLLDYIIADIKLKNAKILELNVNRENNARSFYEKTGFRITDEIDIAIGKGYFMNDYVMQKTL